MSKASRSNQLAVVHSSHTEATTGTPLRWLDTAESWNWLLDGWTEVYRRHETVSSAGWITFLFDTPFSYNGTDPMMIDFAFNNATYSFSGQLPVFTASRPISTESFGS